MLYERDIWGSCCNIIIITCDNVKKGGKHVSSTDNAYPKLARETII